MLKQEEQQEGQSVPHVENRYFALLGSHVRKIDLKIFINDKFDVENRNPRAKK